MGFPYSFEFLYWEEVGIIDVELIRNLIICGAVVACMIFALVPHPRIAIWVVISILLTVIDLIGFMYFWDVTISGISTIYILISVGLAVDYSAHIAHMFVESTGTGPQRAVAALERIGPSVFNAVASTLLAVIIIGFSESYVFIVFAYYFRLVRWQQSSTRRKHASNCQRQSSGRRRNMHKLYVVMIQV